MSYSKNHHQSTILVPESNKELSSDHPLFYVQAKNYFLEQLSNKVSVENRLGTMDLKRNVRIGQFVQRHQQINKQIQKQKRLSKTYLKADEFQSVLMGDPQKIKRDREIKQTQKLRQKLYECYIQEKNVHQQPQRDTANNDYQEWKMSEQNKGAGNFTILSNYRDDPRAKKQLYLLDLQISKIREQQSRDLQVKNKMESCTNNKLLQKVSNSIMSSFMVYFDQIWDVLIDQILQEEVCFLNKLQAEYYLNPTQKNQKSYQNNKNRNDPYENARVLKMMQLVRQLDQLAD